MNRTAVLLTVLAAIALTVVAVFLLIKPRMDEVSELEAEAEQLRAQQVNVEAEIAALEEVRATSPNLEAELAALGAIVPDSLGLPATLRELQMAADASGVTLISVAPGRPAPADVPEAPGLSTITLDISVEGGYFQVVDFLRRIENPAIVARGILVSGVTATPTEYPTLTVTISGQMYAVLEQPVVPDAEPTDEPTDGETDEADVEVDVDVTEEDAA